MWFGAHLDERSLFLYEAVVAQGGIQLSEAASILDLKHPQRLLNGLVEKGLIVSEEEWKERYKPKMARYVMLCADFREEAALSRSLDDLDRKAPKQARVLTGFLSLGRRGVGSRTFGKGCNSRGGCRFWSLAAHG
jgi:primosomal protein N' (replication factor Y)